MLVKEGWVCLLDGSRWRDVYAILRTDEDTRTMTIQYYKKPGDFSPAGVLNFGVASNVEVFEPPHRERGWPNERVIRVKLVSADKKQSLRDDFALLSTSVLDAPEPHEDAAVWGEEMQGVLTRWWENVAAALAEQPDLPGLGEPGEADVGGGAVFDEGADGGGAVARTPSEVATAADLNADVLASGWLWKEGGRWRTWKRRWFELTSIAFTYSDAPRGKLLGDIPVRAGTLVEWEHETVKKEMRYSLRINTPGRLYNVYTTEKPEFALWEAALQAMGCDIRRMEKIPQRGRSNSLSRAPSLPRGGSRDALGVPEPGSLSGGLSKSSTDVSGADGGGAGGTDGGGGRARSARTITAAIMRRPVSTRRLKRLASAPASRPEGVYGQAQFDDFAEMHRFMCPPEWLDGPRPAPRLPDATAGAAGGRPRSIATM